MKEKSYLEGKKEVRARFFMSYVKGGSGSLPKALADYS